MKLLSAVTRQYKLYLECKRCFPPISACFKQGYIFVMEVHTFFFFSFQELLFLGLFRCISDAVGQADPHSKAHIVTDILNPSDTTLFANTRPDDALTLLFCHHNLAPKPSALPVTSLDRLVSPCDLTWIWEKEFSDLSHLWEAQPPTGGRLQTDGFK